MYSSFGDFEFETVDVLKQMYQKFELEIMYRRVVRLHGRLLVQLYQS